MRVETNMGKFVIELDSARAPLTVANFLEYMRAGHYNGTIFHRVIANFVAQGGGYDEKNVEKPVRDGIPNESGNGLSNRRGTVGLARTGDPHSGNAQFYINLADNVVLDPQPSRWGYAVFGRVVEGMNVVDDIGAVATGEVRSIRARRAAEAGDHHQDRGSEVTVPRPLPRDDALHLRPAPRRHAARHHRAIPRLPRSRSAPRRRRCTSSATCSKPGSATTTRIRTSVA